MARSRQFRFPRWCFAVAVAFLRGSGALPSRRLAWAHGVVVGLALGASLSLLLVLALLLWESIPPLQPVHISPPDPALVASIRSLEASEPKPPSPLANGSRLPSLAGKWLNGPPPAPLPSGSVLTVVDVWANW